MSLFADASTCRRSRSAPRSSLRKRVGSSTPTRQEADRRRGGVGTGHLQMIAVGGDVPSRGLTLDGLSIAHFYRQAGAFDTLLQMARWFGYRDGYEDLTRIWIDLLVVNHFRWWRLPWRSCAATSNR